MNTIIEDKHVKNRINKGFCGFLAVPHITRLMVGYFRGNSSLFEAIMYGLMPAEGLIVRRQKKVLRVLKLCFNGFIQRVVQWILKQGSQDAQVWIYQSGRGLFVILFFIFLSATLEQ